MKDILEGGTICRYSSEKTVPYGGWYSMPRSYFDGGLIIGNSRALNSQHLKGIHTAIKSGMLAARERCTRRFAREIRRRPEFRIPNELKSVGSRKSCGSSEIFIKDFTTAYGKG